MSSAVGIPCLQAGEDVNVVVYAALQMLKSARETQGPNP